METVPFQDTLPPRYAIESDDSEDEGGAIPERRILMAEPNVGLTWDGPQPIPQPLVIALGQAGEQWTSGIELGEVRGRVTVDDIEIATAHSPPWAPVTVISVQESLTLYGMHPFALLVINTIRPSSVVIIDVYPVPTYVTSPLPSHPPIRYLRTTASSPLPRPTGIGLFRPPNLIQSPAASFLAILESKVQALPATLFLLPSAHIPPPPPSETGKATGPEIQEKWESSTLVELHKVVNALIGADTQWTAKNTFGNRSRKISKRGDIGEGGMYI